jgi:hypothetical protein
MPVYYGCSYYGFPSVVARYVCRCGRVRTQLGAVHVRKLPAGWHETIDLAGEPEPECPRCHEKTVARRKAAVT